MNIGEKIRAYRQQKKLTQAQLAKLSNISRIALGNYERGERTPTIDIFIRISKALNVSLDELLGIQQNEKEILKNDLKKINCQITFHDDVAILQYEGHRSFISLSFL